MHELLGGHLQFVSRSVDKNLFNIWFSENGMILTRKKDSQQYSKLTKTFTINHLSFFFLFFCCISLFKFIYFY